MRPVGLTAVLLLSACQPQARRLLVLDLALSEPALLNGTVQPWRDEGYNVEYRRFYPHLVRADLDRYRVLLFLLGREPEAPSDALTAGDLALLTEWVLSGGVAVLGYDADGERRRRAGAGHPPAGARGRRPPVPADDRPAPAARRPGANPGVSHRAGALDAPARGVGARPPRGARRAGSAAAGAHSGGAGPPAARAARRSGHGCAAARPRSHARPRDQRPRMAAAAGDARPLGAAPSRARRAPRRAAGRLARFARRAAR